jgi:siroheme synthase-like protein
MALEQDIIELVTGAEEEQKPSVNHLFPVFLKLEELNVLLVGAGNVGLEKLTAILHNAPATKIKVVAKTISQDVRKLVSHYPQVALIERNYTTGDLENIEVLVVATNDKETSALIRNEAKAKNILVNVADTPDLCDFYLGSIVQKGNLKIGISTNGKSPTAAKRIKEVLNNAFPAELDEVILNLHAVRNKLNGNFETKVKKLNEITKVLVEKDEVEKEKRWKKITAYSLSAFALMLIGHVIFSYLPLNDIKNTSVGWIHSLDKNFHWMVLAGFLAQLVDGALGMGYGVTSASILLSTGINPAAISGSIHTAEMFASGASGYSHYKFGNVNKKLFKILVIPGVIGAIAGAFLLVFLGKEYSNYIRPILACYTLFLGVKILFIAFREVTKAKKFKHYGPLAGLGGFLDSFGGGGWGPIVTTTLITKGRSPRFVIGTVSLTEFFVTLASAFSFFILLGVTHMQTIIALILGGFIAAPIAAKLAGKLPRKTSFILLGILVIIWSTKILLQLL